MQNTNNTRLFVGAGAILVVLIGAWYIFVKAPAPEAPIGTIATTTPGTASTTATTTKSSTQPVAVRNQTFPINLTDTIAAWDFKSAYTGNDTLTEQTNADITKLTVLIGTGTFDDYNLNIGLGDDYNLLGNGASAFKYYNRALSLFPNQGLAYVNVAHLMDELGAYQTAADAYKKAVTVQPGMLEFHIERLTYLTRQFPTNNTLITAALADVGKQFGDTAQILMIEAKWLTGQQRYADAIKAWQLVITLSPGKDNSSIQTEIARLQAKQ